jgi:hypothetical protein
MHGNGFAILHSFPFGIEFQRNSASKPRVARHEQPWVQVSNSPTLKRVAPFELCEKGATAVAVEIGYDPFPRVARSSQPWALG